MGFIFIPMLNWIPFHVINNYQLTNNFKWFFCDLVGFGVADSAIIEEDKGNQQKIFWNRSTLSAAFFYVITLSVFQALFPFYAVK